MLFKDKKLAHIVAVGKNGEIGGNNALLWHIPEDLKFFKQMTVGKVLLMGRKTIDSLPSKLKNRITLTLSRDGWSQSTPDSMILQASLSQAYHHSTLLNSDVIFIGGGASLYKATEDIVDELYVTHVDAEFDNADTFYKIPDGFKCVGWVVKNSKSSSGLTYCVKKYERVGDI